MTLVPSFVHKVREADWKKSWLVLGKGPSFAKRKHFDFNKYMSIGLNHTVTMCPEMTYVHVADVDVFEKIEFDLVKRCKTSVVVPYCLHSDNKASSKKIVDKLINDENFRFHKLFRYLYNNNRLFTYKSSLSATHCKRKDLGPSVYVRYFSSVAVVNLLATCDVKNITLLGIDGGSSYSKEFSYLTPLTNGRDSFDVQFTEINRSAFKHKLKVRRIV